MKHFAAMIGCMVLFACTASQNEQEQDELSNPGTSYIDPKMVPVLQKRVTDACLCTRAKGAKYKKACWSVFEAMVSKYHQSSEFATACGPGSESGIVFERLNAANSDEGSQLEFSINDREMNIITSFPYSACSREEIPAKKTEYENKTGMKGC